MMTVPTFRELFIPTLVALKELGGSGSIQEIARTVIEDEEISDDVAQQLHQNGPQTELEYRLAWARTYLRHYGLLSNSERGVWSLSSQGETASDVDPDEIVRHVVQRYKQLKADPSRSQEEGKEDFGGEKDGPLEQEVDWKEGLLETLLEMDSSAFERLCQRVLRESGFIEVKVTGKAGDGGIDGEGIIRIAGIASFRVVFQCKRYRGTVGPAIVRELRGSMGMHADKGLLITTGSFTKSAQEEALRPGFPLIDLIDGDSLAEKLKDLKLGVTTKLVEAVEVNTDWFKNL